MLKCVGGNSCFPAIAFWPELWLADGERARIAGWRRTLCAGAGTTCVLVILSSPLDVVRRSLSAGLRRSDIGEILVCAFHHKRLSLLTLARRANSTRRTWAPSPSKSQQAMMCVQMLSRASRSVWKREKLCPWKKSNTHALDSFTFSALCVPALMAAATQDSAAWCKPYHHLAGRLHRGAPERGARISGAFGSVRHSSLTFCPDAHRRHENRRDQFCVPRCARQEGDQRSDCCTNQSLTMRAHCSCSHSPAAGLLLHLPHQRTPSLPLLLCRQACRWSAGLCVYAGVCV
jgi:hypothetical protein